MKLLPCLGRELRHIIVMIKPVSTELSTARPVYPDVERLRLEAGRTRPHVE